GVPGQGLSSALARKAGKRECRPAQAYEKRHAFEALSCRSRGHTHRPPRACPGSDPGTCPAGTGSGRRGSLPRVKFEHVLVVGAGQMGGGIAEVVAGSGRRVSLYDAAPGAVERGLGAMQKSLAKLAEKGGADPDELLGRVEPVAELVPADLMIEAVVEDPAV